jgi:hypothetical protein
MAASRVLLQQARLDLFSEAGASAIDLKAWIANQNYFIDQDISSSCFSLRAADPNEVRNALANDLDRLASAAFESAAGVRAEPTLPRSLAWGSIRYYYAAFFAAHGLMRLFGTACVYLDAVHVSRILEVADNFGRSGGLSVLSAGFYSARVSARFDCVSFDRIEDSHRDTWNTLLKVLDELSTCVPNATALASHRLEALELLSNLKAGLTRSGSPKGNWLSTLRNSINYRQTHGVWFPYSRSADPAILESAARAWTTKPGTRPLAADRGDLCEFFEQSAALVGLLRELITIAAEMHGQPSAPFALGCLRLLNEAKTPRKHRAKPS